MSKTAELIRLITVLIFAAVLVGAVAYFAPRASQVFQGESVTWTLFPEERAVPDSFGEQATLQRQYAEALQKDIVRLIERTTGPGTVSATVQVDLNLTRETIRQKDVIPAGDSFEGSALSPEDENPFLMPTADVSDFSVTKSWIQSTAGIVQRLSVSVLIDGQTVRDSDGRSLYQPRTRVEMENYTALIKAVIGFEAERGDTLEVLNLPFSDDMRAIGGIQPAVWAQGLCLLIVFGVFVWLCAGFIVPALRHLVDVPAPKKVEMSKPNRGSLEKTILICKQTPDRAVRVLKNLLRQPSQKKRGYAPVQQAAIVLLAVGDGIMRDLFRRMAEEDIRQAGDAIRTLGPVRPEDVRACLDTFIQAVSAPTGVTGSSERVRQIFDKTLPETGERLYSEIRLAAGGQTVWSRLNTLDAGVLVAFLKEQKPDTAALILYHLSDTVSARVIGLLPKEAATRIMIHLTHLRHIRVDVRQKLERDIAVRVCELIQQAQSRSGAEKASAILNAMDKRDEADLMASVSAEAPAAADSVAVWMMRFEDFAKWPDAEIRVLLKYLDRQVAAVALHDAPMAVRDVFVRNMPASVWMSLNKEMARLTPERLREKAAARKTVLKTARELFELGKIPVEE